MMSKVKFLFLAVLLFSLLFGQDYLSGRAINLPNNEQPFETIVGKKAERLIKKAKASPQLAKAKKIAGNKGYELNGKRLAVHIADANTDVVYFYLTKKQTEQDLADTAAFISISFDKLKTYYIQLASFDDQGILHSTLLKNGRVTNEFHIDQNGEFLKGSYTYGEGNIKRDMMELNPKIKKDIGNGEEQPEMKTSFNWNKFWSCLKKQSGPNESLPLRTMVAGACYYVCLTGPASCIACTVINAGISAGIAGYCVKKVW
ncbi:hypothetical protein [Bacillus sp. NPDC077027]|uniref:hypothetical protein n=1 Tax=Bacillus sp. NPDC077027 TaxID=3390548 RepID=UPI003D092079